MLIEQVEQVEMCSYFCAYFCALWGVLRIVAHFSVDHGCLTSSEHPSKARVTPTSLDLAIIF